MTDDKIAFHALLKKKFDATSLLEMIGLATGRLMQLETKIRPR